ncbi:MAG: hypothetical protein WBL27_04720, partial [Salinimicrobium sp.]
FMKKIFTLLLFISGINAAHAQFYGSHPIYTTAEINFGNYIGIDIDLNYLLEEKYTFKIGYTGNVRPAVSRPDDYTAGMKGILFYGFGNPYDQLHNFHIGAGKILKINKRGTIRANLIVGLGFMTIREPVNWEKNDNTFLSESYRWDYKKYNTLSLVFNPKIEFPFTRFYGLTLSPLLQISKDRTFVGVGIGQMLGRLR